FARYVRFGRSPETLNRLYRVHSSITPADVQDVAKKYFTGASLVVTTLSKDPLPEKVAQLPTLESLAPRAASAGEAGGSPLLLPKNALPQINMKLVFAAGSAHDPKGKEGLASLSAAMIADAGSKDRRIDEINKAFFPMAGVFRAQTDKEETTFTASIHRDNWKPFLEIVLPMLTDPGLREDDFKRVKDAHANALKEDLRNSNEEELGKERLQTNIFSGTPYGHPVLGTVAGIEAVTLEDVRNFIHG